MADSFADLWNSSAPQKQTLSSLSSASQASTTAGQQRPKYDAFSIVASSSTPTSQSITPNISKPKLSPAPQKPANGDSFSGLFTSASGAGHASDARMTMAERARKVEQDRLDQQIQRQSPSLNSAGTDAWLGLDSLGTTKAQHSSSFSVQDDWFASVGPTPAPATNKSAAQLDTDADDWGLGDFAAPAPTTSTSTTKVQESQGLVWDDDTLTSTATPPRAPQETSLGRGAGPRDRNNALYAGDSDDESADIFGGHEEFTSRQSSSRNSPGTRQVQENSPVNISAPSPPPHIIGQIVEMGFSPQQARNALSTTSSGMDVQAAIAYLVSGAPPSDASPEAEHRPHPRRSQRPVNRDRQTSSQNQQVTSPDSTIQDQADKMLAQATEIGLNVFGKATAFWSASKEKVQKAYEERVNNPGARGDSTQQGGPARPKWMTEQSSPPPMHEDGVSHAPRGDSFVDAPADPSASRKHNQPRPQDQSRQPPASSRSPREEPGIIDLFSHDASTSGVYVPKSRRGRPKADNTSAPGPSVSPVTTRDSPPPPPRPQVIASASALSACQRHRTSGTEKYKLGQYADAAHAYSLAISSLPPEHLLLIPLCNNRALTRLKIGEYAAAIEDATSVVKTVEPIFNAGRGPRQIGSEAEGGQIDLSDALIKAWKRRAEAWEGREKWSEAGKDWEQVAGASWVDPKTRNEGVAGAGRCRKMVGGGEQSVSQKPPVKRKPEAVRPLPRSGPSPSSAAVDSLRKANDAQEAEDNLRHELKDAVDARIVAWKGGKEANIRALISSLDTVLWPELGWETVGMKDLITEKQVKIKYTRAIGRLHPDKLNARNTTLEHRMIANAVFGSLNDAWNAFQQQ